MTVILEFESLGVIAVNARMVSLCKEFKGILNFNMPYRYEKPEYMGKCFVVFDASPNDRVKGFLLECDNVIDAEILVKEIGAFGYFDLCNPIYKNRLHTVYNYDLS